MTIYALGSNGSGQLGLGHCDDVHTPQPHPLWRSMQLPVAIRAGGNHTLILTTGSQMYLSGATIDEEKLALRYQTKQIDSQTRLIAEDIRLCSATWEATIFVKGNQVLSFGKGDRGELGHDCATGEPLDFLDFKKDKLANRRHIDPTLTASFPRIIDLASSVQHTVLVLDNGEVWGWGNARKGQLGVCHSDNVSQPKRIEGLDFKIVRAVCGREFTFLLGDPLEGRFCVLGSDKWGVKSQAPAAIRGWKDVGACWSSVSVLLETGDIVSWGRNDHGQLAPSGLPDINRIACGSEHCLALTRDGKVLVWGWGEHGNCGSQVDSSYDVKNGWETLQVPDANDQGHIIGIGAGCATSWFWTSTDEG